MYRKRNDVIYKQKNKSDIVCENNNLSVEWYKNLKLFFWLWYITSVQTNWVFCFFCIKIIEKKKGATHLIIKKTHRYVGKYSSFKQSSFK